MEQAKRPTQDPALTLELMLMAGSGMETIAASLMAEFGPEHAASALAMRAVSAPVEGIRGLTHLVTMGFAVQKAAARLEALNFSAWSLVTSEKVPVRARRAIAEALGGQLVESVHETGLRIVDCALLALEDGLVVDGSLSMYRVEGFEATPDRLTIEKTFDLWGCPVRRIGNQLKVKGLMHVRDCPVETWPEECDIGELDLPGQPRAPFRREPKRGRGRTRNSG